MRKKLILVLVFSLFHTIPAIAFPGSVKPDEPQYPWGPGNIELETTPQSPLIQVRERSLIFAHANQIHYLRSEPMEKTGAYAQFRHNEIFTLPEGQYAVDVSADNDYALVTSNTGDVYAFGNPWWGKADSNVRCVRVPLPLKGIKRTIAESRSFFALDSEGRLHFVNSFSKSMPSKIIEWGGDRRVVDMAPGELELDQGELRRVYAVLNDGTVVQTSDSPIFYGVLLDPPMRVARVLPNGYVVGTNKTVQYMHRTKLMATKPRDEFTQHKIVTSGPINRFFFVNRHGWLGVATQNEVFQYRTNWKDELIVFNYKTSSTITDITCTLKRCAVLENNGKVTLINTGASIYHPFQNELPTPTDDPGVCS